MEHNHLLKAISENDISSVKHLTSKQCSPNGNGSRLPPIIECVILKSSGVANSIALFMGLTLKEEDSLRCEILKDLVHHGADVNVVVDPGHCHDIHSYSYIGFTAAMCTAKRGFITCLHLLVACGADLSIRSEDGETALTIAVTQGQDECVKYLLLHMPSSILNSRDIHGRSALMMAALSREPTSHTCMDYLLSAGAKTDLADDDGDTALTFAIFTRNFVAVDMLLRNGAMVNTLTKHGETPLTFVMRYFDSKIIINLLRSGVDPTVSGLDRDCLHETLGREHNSVVRALVMHGFPPLELSLVNLDKFIMSNCATDFLHQLKLIEYLRRTPLSPLALAILLNRADIAKYLIANEFYTRFDVINLCWDRDIRKLLLNSKAMQSLQIIDFLSKKPHSLFNLSLITVSSALTQDLISDPSQENMNCWVFKPTFKERVGLLGLPPALQRALLHQKPSSGICCQKWVEIQLGNTCAESLPAPCSCRECDGVVRTKEETDFLNRLLSV